MGLRSIWNGTISFGAIAVPIKAHSATEDQQVHFHQVHAKDGARIEHQRICSKEDKEVPYKEVAKGYEVSKGKYVVLDKEEVKAAAGAGSHTIDIEDFVCAPEIDPVFFDKTYYLGARDADDAYRLLHDALEKASRAGIGRWVFHNREYLVCIRPLGEVLALHTMRFHDELVDAKDLEMPKAGKKPSDKEVQMASKLVEGLREPFKPEKFEDTYREKLLAMLDAKAKGKDPELPHPDEGSEPDNLMAALEASLAS